MNDEHYPAFEQRMSQLIERGGKLRAQRTQPYQSLSKFRFTDNSAPESRSYKPIPDEHDAYASTDEQGNTVFDRRGVTLERERGWKDGDQHVRVKTQDPDTINEIHREFKSGIAESEYARVENLGIRGAHNYWKFSVHKQAGQKVLAYNELRATPPRD